jgi:hypothetical protein
MVKTIEDLRPDPRNANKSNPRGHGVIENSIRRHGAGRSGLAAKDGTMIAGSQTLEEMQSLGMKIKPVHTTGDEWVVVIRDDVEPGSEQATLMGIEDNRAAEIGLTWDTTVLADLAQEIDLGGLWSDDELGKLLTQKQTLSFLDDAGEDEPPLSTHSQPHASEQARIPLAIVLTNAQARQWREYKESVDMQDDTRAFLEMLKAVAL